MIKQLLSKDIKKYLTTETDKKKRVLLDVRTEEEWSQFGKPDGEKLGLKTYFLTIEDDNFVKEFKNLSINQDSEILAMCAAGARSQVASELLTKENYSCVNISDGFTGWMIWDLPHL